MLKRIIYSIVNIKLLNFLIVFFQIVSIAGILISASLYLSVVNVITEIDINQKIIYYSLDGVYVEELSEEDASKNYKGTAAKEVHDYLKDSGRVKNYTVKSQYLNAYQASEEEYGKDSLETFLDKYSNNDDFAVDVYSGNADLMNEILNMQFNSGEYEELGTNEVYLPKSYAEARNYNIGDIFEVAVEKAGVIEFYELKIKDLYEFEKVEKENEFDFNSDKETIVLLLSYDTFLSMVEEPEHSFEGFYIGAKEDEVQKITGDLKSFIVNPNLEGVINLSEENVGANENVSEMKNLFLVILFVSVAVFLITTFSIRNTILNRRIKEIRLYEIFGLVKKQVLLQLYVERLILLAVASLIAIMFGIWGVNNLKDLVQTLLEYAATTVTGIDILANITTVSDHFLDKIVITPKEISDVYLMQNINMIFVFTASLSSVVVMTLVIEAFLYKRLTKRIGNMRGE